MTEPRGTSTSSAGRGFRADRREDLAPGFRLLFVYESVEAFIASERAGNAANVTKSLLP